MSDININSSYQNVNSFDNQTNYDTNGVDKSKKINKPTDNPSDIFNDNTVISESPPPPSSIPGSDKPGLHKHSQQKITDTPKSDPPPDGGKKQDNWFSDLQSSNATIQGLFAYMSAMSQVRQNEAKAIQQSTTAAFNNGMLSGELALKKGLADAAIDTNNATNQLCSGIGGIASIGVMYGAKAHASSKVNKEFDGPDGKITKQQKKIDDFEGANTPKQATDAQGQPTGPTAKFDKKNLTPAQQQEHEDMHNEIKNSKEERNIMLKEEIGVAVSAANQLTESYKSMVGSATSFKNAAVDVEKAGLEQMDRYLQTISNMQNTAAEQQRKRYSDAAAEYNRLMNAVESTLRGAGGLMSRPG